MIASHPPPNSSHSLPHSPQSVFRLDLTWVQIGSAVFKKNPKQNKPPQQQPKKPQTTPPQKKTKTQNPPPKPLPKQKNNCKCHAGFVGAKNDT